MYCLFGLAIALSLFSFGFGQMVEDAAAGDISRVEKEIDSLATDEEQHEDVGFNATQFYRRIGGSDNASCDDRYVARDCLAEKR